MSSPDLADQIASELTAHWRSRHAVTGTPCSGCTKAVLRVVRPAARGAGPEELSRTAREQFYLRTLRQEYRRLGPLRRWLLWRMHPSLEIAVRHLAEDPDTPPASSSHRPIASEECT